MTIPDDIHTEILKRINDAELEHNVKVLYAVESGSRAWGFASQNSDYDVRFIYAHPKDWYVAVELESKRDVIEYDIIDEIDINGWDVRKALKLFRKSNPTFVEWLHSPIVYIDDEHFAHRSRLLLDDIYSVEKGIYHYRSMAKTNYSQYLKKPEVLMKKYFYCLRPLLSILWLEKYQRPAPIEFERLRAMVVDNAELNTAIEDILIRKKTSREKDLITPIQILHAFIETELDRLKYFSLTPEKKDDGIHQLNELFHATLSG